MKYVLIVDQLDRKPALPEAFTGLFSDPAAGSLIVDAIDLYKGKPGLPIVGLADEIEVEARVCRAEGALDPPQGEGASKAVRILF